MQAVYVLPQAVQSRIVLVIAGTHYDQWTSAEVVRDLKDFSGSFRFALYDPLRSGNTFAYASTGPLISLEPGPAVEILVDGELVLKGHIEDVSVDIDEGHASVEITGRDKTGDLVDSAALTDGPAEFNNVKLEEAIKRIAQPFGLTVRSEVDTGEPFSRYSLDLAETAFSASEKGARSRHALVLSDGVGGIVITRTGAKRAPDDLTLPGNVQSSSRRYSHRGRHSKTHVRGQGERAGQKKRGAANLDVSAEPLSPDDRKPGDGSATEQERKGTVASGVSVDEEITRHRPIVHLARSKADGQACQDEADWRMRNSRTEGEQLTYKVQGFSANGQLWRVNEIAAVDDAYQNISRDMLISRVANRHDERGAITELSIVSPESFDKKAVGNRRKNGKGKKSKHKGGPLDGSAQAI
ncbi:Mu P family protein [Rhizobium sp. P38BS-XIX]|uniref:phage baseplate assembly protein n=1 Tax=Rhizobium sp. P38BS-XIX TaxID=2726740 RepID=UPI001457098D|nr:Mu P family protein [Rhizobium sp. P38BS-XIX]NLS00176.1 Mu P family protein [Rhizobium sp. P38BS-XIX]